MSKHREPAAQSAPSNRNVTRPSPATFPQRIDWFAETERLRTERKLKNKNFCVIVENGHAAMTFKEINKAMGFKQPHMARYVFNRAMYKLTRMRDSELLRQLLDLSEMRQELMRKQMLPDRITR